MLDFPKKKLPPPQVFVHQQGCQILLGTTYQNVEKNTKGPQNIPNGHKAYEMVVKYSK
jgi:hypothetical protein